jgi:soluble lytic murein transglycosylase-like protein
MRRRALVYAAAFALASALLPSLALASVPREAVQYRADLTRAARFVWGMSAPVATFAGQVHQESAWKATARSKFAGGLAQFTPDTAEWIGTAYKAELGRADPFNPGWALRALVRYDRHLYERFAFAAVECDRWAFVLAAYNGGPGWIGRDRAMAAQAFADPDRWFGHVEHYTARAAWAKEENRAYPRRILLRHQRAYASAGWGHAVACDVR